MFVSSRLFLSLLIALITQTGATIELSVLWLHSTSNSIRSAPAIGLAGQVYVGSRSGVISSVNGDTGATLWSRYIEPTQSTPAVRDDGKVYVATTTGRIACLNGENGNIIWFRTLYPVNYAGIALDEDGNLYISTSSIARLFKLDGNTGNVLWSYFTSFTAYNGATVQGDTVYQGTLGNGKLYAIDTATGLKKWEFSSQIQNSLMASYPSVSDDGSVFFSTCDGSLWALNSLTGSIIWRYNLGACTEDGSLYWNGVVYVGTLGRKMIAVDAVTGSRIWEYYTSSHIVSVPAMGFGPTEGVLFFAEYGRTVHAVNCTTGERLSTFSLGSVIYQTEPRLAPSGAVLYIGNDDGKLYALKLTSDPLPTQFPTQMPSSQTTAFPTYYPTVAPSGAPSSLPSFSPTISPTSSPTSSPTVCPSLIPTSSPSTVPTATPTMHPTLCPTNSPTSFPTRNPTQSPTVSPTGSPSAAPTVIPTSLPTLTPTSHPTRILCIPGDVSYCNNRGYCSDTGDECVCYDYLHYWPSEQCSTWHDGRELEDGWFCYPDTVDQYCSWQGTCSHDGLECLCHDTEHRYSEDRCSTWYASLPTSSPSGTIPPISLTLYPTYVPSIQPPSFQCIAGDREICHNRGYCSDTGDECVCDDYLHYWPSEQCSTWHDGRELEDGWFCYPDTVDQYCSWQGTCSHDGLECLCHDTEHRYSEDRCSTWYASLPTTSLTLYPTYAPSIQPPSFQCIAGDREICHNRGYCSDTGDECVCDDYLHYWPSEQCSTWHDGRELEDGWFCYPDTVDQYCSWQGTCSHDGLECLCHDTEHRYSEDRCSTWYPIPPTISSFLGASEFSCFPSSRSECNNNGYCHASGTTCVCDNMHYWATEQCMVHHLGPELNHGECCLPGSVDYYCSWLGTCNSNGTACICHDSDHRSPADRCREWYLELPVLSTPIDGTCPVLLDVNSEEQHEKVSEPSTTTLFTTPVLILFILCATIIVVGGVTSYYYKKSIYVSPSTECVTLDNHSSDAVPPVESPNHTTGFINIFPYRTSTRQSSITMDWNPMQSPYDELVHDDREIIRTSDSLSSDLDSQNAEIKAV